jgi:signal recognition particle receptor subunit beta
MANIEMTVISCFALIMLKRSKERRPLDTIISIGLYIALVCGISMAVVWFTVGENLNREQTKLLFIWWIIFILLFKLILELITLCNFAKENYPDFTNHTEESYNLIDDSEINIRNVLRFPTLYLLVAAIVSLTIVSIFAWFFIKITSDIGVSLVVVSAATISAIDTPLRFIFIAYSFVVFGYILLLFFEKRRFRYPTTISVVTLFIATALKFLKCDIETVNVSFESTTTYLLCYSVFLLYLGLLKKLNGNVRVLRANESVFQTDLDLVMRDSPVDHIYDLLEACAHMVYSVHSIFENCDKDIPLNILLTGKTGSGKSSILKTLSMQISRINRFSIRPINANDSYKKKYFGINIDLSKLESPKAVCKYIHEYIRVLCKIHFVSINAVNSYLDKVLTIMAENNAAQHFTSFFRAYREIGKEQFATIELRREDFQETIGELLKRTRRAGIILFVDGRNNAAGCDNANEKIFSLLNEFYNINGIKMLIACEAKDGPSDELKGLVNMAMSLDDIVAYTPDINDSSFNKLISITAKETVKYYAAENTLKVFEIFERQIADNCAEDNYNRKPFSDLLTESIVRYVYREYKIDYVDKTPLMDYLTTVRDIVENSDADVELLRQFIFYLTTLTSNPKDCKNILRNAILKRKTILECFIEDFCASQNESIDQTKTLFEKILADVSTTATTPD